MTKRTKKVNLDFIFYLYLIKVEPMLVIYVNLGDTNERIFVYRGDAPKDLSKKFAQDHGKLKLR